MLTLHTLGSGAMIPTLLFRSQLEDSEEELKQAVMEGIVTPHTAPETQRAQDFVNQKHDQHQLTT